MYIKVVDGSDVGNPEVLAMLQAFYSRSPMPIEKRLELLNAEGTGESYAERLKNAIGQYYVGYGHASIGDCGNTTVFIENVSMLAAKAIQDTPLYDGQECSTRYLDFSTQPFVHYCKNNTFGNAILGKYRALYLDAKKEVRTYIHELYPQDVVVSDTVEENKRDQAYAKTLDAITFDIVRGLLPCGAQTSLAWTGSLRTLSDHCKYLSTSELPEVRETAFAINSNLRERYPNSFEPLNIYSPRSEQKHYYVPPSHSQKGHIANLNSVWFPDGEQYARETLNNTKPGELPRHLRTLAYFKISGELDYGSMRDLLRHRNGQNVLPEVTGTYLHNWYLSFLKTEHVNRLKELVEVSLDEPHLTRQYIMPLATVVPVNVHWTLGQLQYVCRLRSSTSVHPTLRRWIRELHDSVVVSRPYLQPFLKIDSRRDYEAANRGTQTIEKK